MKKKLWCIGVALFCCLIFGVIAKPNNVAYAITEETEAQESVENKKFNWKELLDYAAVGAGGVATALSFGIPIFVSIKKAKKNIEQVADLSREESSKHSKIIDDFKNYEHKLEEKEKELKEYENTLKELNLAIKRTERMCKIGFSNMKELVQNGTARNIIIVGGEDEEQSENNSD